jgi:phosphopantothenoylcysteine decarboxylase/phosphopantothenate--cysteine ligase
MSREIRETQDPKIILKKDIFIGKTIALGVSGGIACYKVVDLASRLTQLGAIVKTIMTENAAKFVTPLTFQTITGQPVITDLFTNNENKEIHHVSISEEADVFVVAPATANIMAKAAHGVADDALSTTILAARRKVIMVPAMNNHMWLNPATQQNAGILKERGVYIVGPEVGRLACGEENAIGRLAEVDMIIAQTERVLSQKTDLNGLNIMVTAGGTREPIDPVRFIGNRSSGKMGYAIAEAAVARGANVILITGPSCLAPPHGVEVMNIETAQQMYEAVAGSLQRADVVVMAAAVADVKPAVVSGKKIKKDIMAKNIELELNPDILQAITANKGDKIIVGFAAESEHIVDNATEKLRKKDLDLIVANDISIPGAGFESDRNFAVLIDKKGPIGKLETYQKKDLAQKILDRIGGLI